jgi:putative ABC transport system substrate-binding protein
MTIWSIKRRDFITLLAGATVAWPLAARAQQPAMPVIGFLSSASATSYADRVRAFQAGLDETGYLQGRNVAIEFRWADGENDRLPAMAAELVRRPVAVIIGSGGAAARTAKASTSIIPVVFTGAGDPVELGLVASLSRPGANVTGATNLNQELGPKRLELLHELVPAARKIALLVNPTNTHAAESEARDMQAAAARFGLELQILNASTDDELEALLTALSQVRADALMIGADSFLNSRREKLGALTALHRLPAIQNSGEFAAAGGLAGFGGSGTDAYRIAGSYAGRILKGEKPADLPVQQSTKAELIINLKTAKALGLSVPLSLLGRADEVIE